MQTWYWASEVALVVKNLPASTGDIRDTSSVPGLGRSPGGGHNNPLQYSCLENPMDRRAWLAKVHATTKSRTQLNWFSMHTCTPQCTFSNKDESVCISQKTNHEGLFNADTPRFLINILSKKNYESTRLPVTRLLVRLKELFQGKTVKPGWTWPWSSK